MIPGKDEQGDIKRFRREWLKKGVSVLIKTFAVTSLWLSGDGSLRTRN